MKEKVKINIKNKWKDISIGEYQSIIEIMDNEQLNNEEKQNELITIITGLDYEDVLKLDLNSYKRILDSLSFLSEEIKFKVVPNTITIGKSKFKVMKKLSDITTGQYLNLEYLLKEGKDTENLHKIVSIFLISEDEDKEFHIQQLMSIEDAYSIFFYLRVLSKRLLKCFHKYSVKKKKTLI